MTDHPDPTRDEGLGGIGQRTPRLARAVREASDEMSVTLGLPDEIGPGSFAFTYMAEVWGEPQAQDVSFDWDGGSTVTWTQDISGDEAISPGSGAPVSGWASWLNGEDLLLAFSGPDLELEGWARVPGGAPTASRPGDDADDESDEPDPDEALADPARWVALARTITAVVCEQEVPGAEVRRYGWQDEGRDDNP